MLLVAWLGMEEERAQGLEPGAARDGVAGSIPGALAVFAGLVLVYPLNPGDLPRLQLAALNAIALPLYVVLVAAASVWWRLRHPHGKALLLALALAAAHLMVLTFARTSPGEAPDLAGAGWRLAGLACGGLAAAALRPDRVRGIRLAWMALFLAAAATAWVPVLRISRAEHWAGVCFPALGDFEDSRDLGLWVPLGGDGVRGTRLSLSGEHAANGERCLRVETGARGIA
ncbi:MAG: hypothetical protein ACC661_04120, partial [Verrucomicrobiales bacterium]